jgi:cation diffusion facilitator family transporter
MLVYPDMPGSPELETDAEALANLRRARMAMRVSLWAGIAILGIKWLAYAITGSTAILSDAMESVLHIIAVMFAAFAMRLSHRPATESFRYGYERISFFSAGFEGSMIALAAAAILWAVVDKWLHGFELQQIGMGVLMTCGLAVLNAGLAWYLIRTGKRTRSIILVANGKHVLTDGWTSAGVVLGLVLVQVTGWRFFDPLVAIAVAMNILWSGFALMRQSIGGLMDYVDPKTARTLRASLDELCGAEHVEYHGLRFRDTGLRLIVEVHLLFPYETVLGQAHQLATRLEEVLPARVGRELDLITHLEALEDHGEVHSRAHGH